MIRRVFRGIKPLGLAVLTLLLVPCVAEFALRLSACRRGFEDRGDAPGVAVAASWRTHHELVPLQSVQIADADPLVTEPVQFRTNSLGLRGSEPDIPRPPGVFRVLVLGDETVLSPRIPESATFCALLEEWLQANSQLTVEVINAGVPDFCPLLSYLHLRNTLLALDPDLVVACFDMSDVWDDRRVRRLTDLGTGEQPLACTSPDLTSTPGARPLTENFVCVQWAEWKLVSLFGGQSTPDSSNPADNPRLKYAWLNDDAGDWTLQVGLTLSAYDHLAVLCERRSTPLVLSVHPAPWQVTGTAAPDARVPDRNGIYPGTLLESSRPFDTLREFSRTRAVPLCDLAAVFQKTPDPDSLFQTDSRGFSRAGHELYARELAQTVLRTVPGPWRTAPVPSRDTQPAVFTQPSPEPRSGPVSSRASAVPNGLVPLSVPR